MLVKVSSLNSERVHFWNYETFKKHHDAKVKSWSNKGNLINFIVYEINGKVDQELTHSLGLKFEYLSQ